MNQDSTQPIRPDDDATVIMVHPDHMPVAPPPPAPRSRAWVVLFSTIGVLLFAAGAILGAFVVSGAGPSEAELEQARQEAVDEGFANGYDEGFEEGVEEAEAEAKTEISDAYRSGYEDGFDAGAAARAEQPAEQDKPKDSNQGADKADKE